MEREKLSSSEKQNSVSRWCSEVSVCVSAARSTGRTRCDLSIVPLNPVSRLLPWCVHIAATILLGQVKDDKKSKQ